MNEFAKTFRELVHRSKKSLAHVARDSGVDVAYVRKLASGEKRHPSHLTVIKLMIGLVADESMAARDPQIVQHGLGMLLSAMLSDAVAGDHLK